MLPSGPTTNPATTVAGRKHSVYNPLSLGRKPTLDLLYSERNAMKFVQFGCKKCDAVITVERNVWSDKIEVRTKEAKTKDHFGKMEIECTKCHKPVAILSIDPV